MSDMEIITDILKDEVEGINEYTKMLDVVEDEVLKAKIVSIIADEKQHAQSMLVLLQEKIQ